MERKLYKSPTNRVFFGVCGGLGEYFDVDPVIIRLLTVVFTLMGGAGLLAYIVAAIVIPERDTLAGARHVRPETAPQPDDVETPVMPAKKKSGGTSMTFGIILIAMGALVLVNVFLPWIQDELILAAALIGLGLYFVAKRS